MAKRWTHLLALGLWACLAAWGQTQASVGGQVCRTCHADTAQGFNRNPHFQSALEDCESCHGPGASHVSGNGDISKIVRFDALPPNEVLDRCLACHAEDLGKTRIRRSAHSTSDISCISCHSIHGSKDASPLLAQQEREVCYTCHAEVRARFNLPFKHRVNEGAMKCSDCHDPHGAPVSTWAAAGTQGMVRHAVGNDIACTGCHTDKRGPFTFEHAPVRIEGCATCHNPHGSTNPRLLARPAVFTLCLECHTGTVALGTRGEGIPNPTVGFHNLASPQFQNCVTCHSRIHGSNADPLLKR